MYAELFAVYEAIITGLGPKISLSEIMILSVDNGK